ncbi:MAG: NDP-hexose 4-ketoreductase [Frankiales bacterium]|nr:NDP-hexose 4-ketoreductase [Frankiales bacterium]
MFERFTARGHHAVVLAQDAARELEHESIGTEHLLLGLLEEGEGAAARVLTSYGLTPEGLRGQVELLAGRGSAPPGVGIPFTPEAKAALQQSLHEADEMHHAGVGTEHVLLGVLAVAHGITSTVLAAAQITADEARLRVLREIS